jgi:hypothetical protein
VGTDIHAVIEYEPDHGLHAFTEGQLALPADYALFHALAGVRRQTNDPPLYPARGMPERVSNELLRAYFTPVVEDEDARTRPLPWGEFFILRSKVEANPYYKSCEYWGGPEGPRRLISDPDWHTPSWLTYREVLAALDHLGLSVADRSVEFRAAVAAMAELAREVGPDRVRLVFLFDN